MKLLLLSLDIYSLQELENWHDNKIFKKLINNSKNIFNIFLKYPCIYLKKLLR